jgi:hypothetical protein
MKKTLLVILISVMLVGTASAGDNWKFYFFGIDYDDVKDRKWSHVVGGAVSSLVVHELGHLAFGRMAGFDTSFNFNEFVAEARWDGHSTDAEKAWFYRGGFVAQALVGTVLTAIPRTRHADFTVGFNGFTFVNSGLYVITGGFDNDTSDIQNLNRAGYNGNLEGGLTSLYGVVLTYINLNKVK